MAETPSPPRWKILSRFYFFLIWNLPLFSFINIIISTICSAGVLSRILTVSEVGNEARIISCLVPHFLGVVFSLMFIFYDKICCCCCDCFLGAEERIVYDPSHPENKLIWENGKVLYVDIELKHLVFILFF